MEEITKTVENMQIKPTQVHLPTCRICLKPFERKFNGPKECIYHPESFTGETAQRWMDPGETKGASNIINFYSCCGMGLDSKGCCYTSHKSFDEPETEFNFRRPGMGIDS